MKRQGNLFNKIYDMDNLILAHKHASRGKGWYAEVKKVNENPIEYLSIIQHWLKTQTFTTSKYKKFKKIDKNKERIIYKLPYFPDRIAQWSLLQVIEPILLKQFIKDTYSAIPKRGIHKCYESVMKALRDDPEGTQYCFKFDIKKFYPSINHDILKKKFRRIIKDNQTLWLIDDIIDSTNDEGTTGIPIGNYVSQYCGNFYLSSLDHWVKETIFIFDGKEWHVFYYFRYMDDVIILSNSKEFLHYLKCKIDVYLHQELRLTMKENWQIFKVDDRGIDFVGYKMFHDHVRLRKSTYINLRRCLTKIQNKIEKEGVTAITFHDYCCFNSYKGWIQHFDSTGLYKKYFEKLEIPMLIYYYNNLLDPEKRRKIELKEFLKTRSTIQKPEFWEDDYFAYVLLSQSQVTENEGEDNEFKGYEADYAQYTKEEWNNLITKEIKEKTIKQLDQSLAQVKENKIAETKELLEVYYQENPLYSTVHNPEGENYSVTSEKQSYLANMLLLVDQAEKLGLEYSPTWNATGEPCEPWTVAELRQLSLQIAQSVYPAVSKQQSYEKQIRDMENVEEIQQLQIVYGEESSNEELG